MSIIKSAFSWLAGKHNTGIPGTTDNLTDQYRDYFPRLQTPGIYTTENVQAEVAKAAAMESQAELAKVFHQARRQTIKSLDLLDSQTTETAVLYSDKAVEISGRRSKAQEKILPNQVRTQLNNSRTNAMKAAYARGLEIHAGI